MWTMVDENPTCTPSVVRTVASTVYGRTDYGTAVTTASTVTGGGIEIAPRGGS